MSLGVAGPPLWSKQTGHRWVPTVGAAGNGTGALRAVPVVMTMAGSLWSRLVNVGLEGFKSCPVPELCPQSAD